MSAFSKFARESQTSNLRYDLAECFINAAWNKSHAYSHLNLKFVVGSLGLAGHFEYGGKDYTASQFKAKPSDSHGWLEDEEGNVYDFIFPEYAEYATHWGKKPQFATGWAIEGISKADLLADGLEYVPAPPKAEKVIKNFVVSLATGRKNFGMMDRETFTSTMVAVA